jgi:DNA-binding GntR family transcriptional regulator
MKERTSDSSLAAAAYAVVRERILRGEIGLGQVISRRKLAAELHMSFLPVSEALLKLEVEGLLESRPRAGTRVRIPSPEDIKGHYIVREALEVQAAIRVSQMATAAERAELLRLGARVDALHRQPDRSLFVPVHQRLHARIAQCARCPTLLEAIEKTHALASTWFSVMRQPAPTDNQTRHQELVEAVAGTDPTRAADAVRQHIAVATERTLTVLQPYFRLRKTTGSTFYRSDRQLLPEPLDRSQLH